MSDKKVFTARDGAVFIQADPATVAEWTGCWDLGDISSDQGDIELLQDFDVQGEYETLGHTEGAPSAISFDMTTWTDKASEILEKFTLPFYLHVNLRCIGVANVLNNYSRAVVLKVVKRTNQTLTGLVMRNEDTAAENKFSLAAYQPLMHVYKLTAGRQTTAETENARDIIFVKENIDSNCNLPRFEAGKIGMAVFDAAGGVAANVQWSMDGGSNWTTCAADPFGADENVSCVTYFWLDEKRVRFLVGRGSTDAGNPAEVAYTDFNLETDIAIGAVWTLANVGAVNAQFFFGPKALYAYDKYNIWGVAGAGYIYKSSNSGVTWAAQEAGLLSTEDYYVVTFRKGSKREGWTCGENNAVAKTHDGGVTWSAVVGPSAADELLTMDVLSETHVFVGNNTGELWVTFNGGLSWRQITDFTGTGVGQVRAVKFLNEVQGFMLNQTAGPVGSIHVSRDCGLSWKTLNVLDNDGYNALDVISASLVYGCGQTETTSATAMIFSATA